MVTTKIRADEEVLECSAWEAVCSPLCNRISSIQFGDHVDTKVLFWGECAA